MIFSHSIISLNQLLQNFKNTAYIFLTFRNHVKIFLSQNILHNVLNVVYRKTRNREIRDKGYLNSCSNLIQNNYRNYLIYRDNVIFSAYHRKISLATILRVQWQRLPILSRAVLSGSTVFSQVLIFCLIFRVNTVNNFTTVYIVQCKIKFVVHLSVLHVVCVQCGCLTLYQANIQIWAGCSGHSL